MKSKQLGFDDVSNDWQREMLPAHIQLIESEGKGIEQIVEEMMRVPLDRTILVDRFLGYQRGDYRKFDEEWIELLRLQDMLNSKFHSQRFDWTGDNPLSQMVRESITKELWKPKLKETIPLLPK